MVSNPTNSEPTSVISALIHCPAKINLSLEILGKRQDGYHELQTVMVPVCLNDRLLASLRQDKQVRLSIISTVDKGQVNYQDFVSKIPTGPDNLVVKIALAFQKSISTTLGADLQLLKGIPAGAGLGGASSDAAATLVALNRIWNANWNTSRLADFSSEFGSDIPFFFYGSAAECTGRGEKIETVPCDSSVWMVIVRPRVGLSTPQVFQTLNARKLPPMSASVDSTDSAKVRNLPETSILTGIAQGRWGKVGISLHNDLKPPAFQILPHLKHLEDCIQKTNPLGFEMSGSGSCFFALYRNKRSAIASAKHLMNMAVGTTFVVRPTARTLIKQKVNVST